MILKESVRNLLVRHPYRCGKIGLPRPNHDIFNNYKICDGKYSIELIDTKNRENVRTFMLGIDRKKLSNNAKTLLDLLDEFYSTAPVPVALQLYKDRKGEKCISNFLSDELSLFLDCGVSFAIVHQRQVIGIGMNLLFERFWIDEIKVCSI